MSQENVEFVKGLYTAAETMDKEQLLAALPALIEQVCDPDIEWVEDPRRADGQTHRGHAGVLRCAGRTLGRGGVRSRRNCGCARRCSPARLTSTLMSMEGTLQLRIEYEDGEDGWVIARVRA